MQLAMKQAARIHRARTLVLALGLAAALCGPSVAATPEPPRVDLSGLPALGDGWREDNPYRGNPQAVDTGRAIYAQSCARCHGAEATKPGPASSLSDQQGAN